MVVEFTPSVGVLPGMGPALRGRKLHKSSVTWVEATCEHFLIAVERHGVTCELVHVCVCVCVCVCVSQCTVMCL